PASSPIQSNPLLQRPISSDLHATSPGRSRSLSHRTRDSHAAWAAAEGLLPISEAFQMPGYVPAHIVGGITYSVRSLRSAQFRPAGQEADIQASADYPVALPTPSGPQRLPSERIQNESMHAPAYTPFPQRARSFTPSVSTATHLPSPANTITSSHLRELACHQLSHWEVAPEPPFNSASSRPLGSHPAISPDLLAAIASALGSTASPYVPNPESSQPVRKFFSRTITNTTSELPIAVIKELRSGFKSYIPLALCTHKACSNATRSSDAFDTEIGMNERGEIRLKQKTLTASKDYTISTNDFTEIRENFTRGLKKYLIFGEDVEPGGERALACAGMFSDFFSIIASRPDYTQDWPSYRGYIIEQYTSWIGRRDDSFGLIFDEHLFHKYKMKVLVPSILEQLR
ncbi:hypothetical protein BYT27DRAFT_7036661, partial [Phlegmacium glaucopus]